MMLAILDSFAADQVVANLAGVKGCARMRRPG